MKTFIISTILLTSGILFTNTVSAQQKVVPVQNKAVKKMDQKNTTGSSSENVTLTNSTNNDAGTKMGQDNSSPTNSKGNVQSENPYNATRDDAEYNQKKMDWIKNNPDKYKAKSGNPNLKFITEAELNALPENEKSAILADEENYIIIR